MTLFFVSALAGSASATDNYEYGPDEYVTITKGISPDGKFAITSHGEGELGYDHFHLYLTDTRTGKNIGTLEEIVKILDTGPGLTLRSGQRILARLRLFGDGRGTTRSFQSGIKLKAEERFPLQRLLWTVTN